MKTVTALLNVMRSFLGIHEVPDGSNNTPIGVEYGWDYVAWCAETVSVAMKRIGFPWFHTASVSQIIAWAKSGFNGLSWHPGTGDVQAGDVACYGNGEHTGVVESVNRTNNTITTIEGNWGNKVQRLVRQLNGNSYITGFARPPYSPEAAPTPPVSPGAPVQHLPTPATHIKQAGVLQSGDAGLGVQLLQLRLNAVEYCAQHAGQPAYHQIVEDGQFGGDTAGMVHWFEVNQHISVDAGIAGPQVMSQLSKVEAFLGIHY